MPRILVLLFILFLTPYVLSQSCPPNVDCPQLKVIEDYSLETHAYNMGINAVLGGIGSVINKRPSEKWGKAFIRGFGFGAAGGYIKLKGKQINRLIAQRNTPEFAWLSKTVYFAGSSIAENAAANRPILSNWHYMIGFLRFDLSLSNEAKFTTRLMPFNFIGTLHTLFTTDHFDANLSIRTGTPIFRENNLTHQGVSLDMGPVILQANQEFEGVNTLYTTIAHEEVHQRQNFDFVSLNYALDPLFNKVKLYKKSQKYLFWDYTSAFISGLYNLGEKEEYGNWCKYNNFFEAEAEWFTDKRFSQCDF